MSYIAKDDTGKVIKQGLSEFVIGEEQEPPGLELGVRTMRVGEKAFIHCTARYAYSEAYVGTYWLLSSVRMMAIFVWLMRDT